MKLLGNLELRVPNVPNATPGLFIQQPLHGMFFVDPMGKLAFQRTSELELAPHMHLYALYKMCLMFPDISKGFEKHVIDEGNRRKMDVTQAPSLEVKQEAIDLIEDL